MGRGRAPCCDKNKVKRGPWSPAEDLRLISFIQKHGHGNWRALPKQAGLLRCGKSCRLRWINYLRPDVKRGGFSPEEEDTIIRLHSCLGNKWSKIASYLPGRTDNEIKNVWNTYLKKRAMKAEEDGSYKNGAKDQMKASTSSPSCRGKNNMENNGQDDRECVTTDHVRFGVTPPSCVNHQTQQSDQLHSPNSSYSSNISSFSQSADGLNNSMEPLEIPLGSDFNELWNILDSLETDDSHQSHSKEEVFDNQELECREWLRHLENELGVGLDGHNPRMPADSNVLLHPDIDFPMWPVSPLHF